MYSARNNILLKISLLSLMAAIGILPGISSSAQDSKYSDDYAIGEAGKNVGRGDQAAGPVRLARFSFVHGNVTWRPDDEASWSTASINLPIRQGAQIWVTDGGRAELQFDDGSLLRLGNNAVATLQTLYSDSEGEFTELKLNDGISTLVLKHDHSVFQVDTPLVSMKAIGPARLRIGTGDGVEIGVRQGQATVDGVNGKVTLQKGDYLDLANAESPYEPRNLPRADSWELWNDERDQRIRDADRSYETHHLASNIALVAADLDDYGSWRDDPQYGSVWCPRVSHAGWRPYNAGRWVWVNPYGWTWVSEEPWGWAPYHYGTWVSASYGWAWVPGPVHQYWSPAVVHFSEYEGNVAWCPLAPVEVRYPPNLSIGFRGGNWSAFFSIGGAAVYYPHSAGYFAPQVYSTRYVNHVTVINNTTNVFNNNTIVNNNTYYSGRAIIPVNSRNAGVTTVQTTAFGGSASYQQVSGSGANIFQRGRSVAAPAGSNQAPTAGPIAVRPTREATTINRSFTAAATTAPPVMKRTVYRAPVNPVIAQTSSPFPTGTTRTTTTRAGTDSGFPGRNGSRTDPGNGARTNTDTGARTGRGSTDNGNGSRTNGDVGNRGGRGSVDTGDGSKTNTGNRTDRSSTTGSTSTAAEAARRARESVGAGSSRIGTSSGTGTGSNRTGEGTRTNRSGGTSGDSGTRTDTSRTNPRNDTTSTGRSNPRGDTSSTGTSTGSGRTQTGDRSTGSPRRGDTTDHATTGTGRSDTTRPGGSYRNTDRSKPGGSSSSSDTSKSSGTKTPADDKSKGDKPKGDKPKGS